MTSKPPRLSENEKQLVRDAIRRAVALPSSLTDEEHVLRLLRIRRKLETDLLALYDPGRLARPWLIGGWVATLLLNALVIIAGLWRALVRYDSPIPGLDDPLSFLGWFILALIIAWLPLLVAWLRARAIRRRIVSSEVPDPDPALSVYDTATVRNLIRPGTS